MAQPETVREVEDLGLDAKIMLQLLDLSGADLNQREPRAELCGE
jgi:hypothetical protein